jgi:hypothetical protein
MRDNHLDQMKEKKKLSEEENEDYRLELPTS